MGLDRHPVSWKSFQYGRWNGKRARAARDRAERTAGIALRCAGPEFATSVTARRSAALARSRVRLYQAKRVAQRCYLANPDRRGRISSRCPGGLRYRRPRSPPAPAGLGARGIHRRERRRRAPRAPKGRLSCLRARPARGLPQSDKKSGAICRRHRDRARDRPMSGGDTGSYSVRRLTGVSDAEVQGLTRILIDCVDGGASVGFMHPLSPENALAYWRGIAADVARGARALLVAADQS